MIKAVIFDMGGVLLRTDDRTSRTVLAKKYGMAYPDIDQLVFNSPSAKQGERGDITEEEHWQKIAQHLHLDREALEAFQTGFGEGDRVDTVLIDLIRSLRPAYRTGLLSNAWSNARRIVAERYRLLDSFDVCIFSAEEGLAKPDPGIYQLMLSKLAVLPDEAVFVDDMLVNIEAAVSLGMNGILFSNTEQARKEVLALLRE